MYLAVSGGGSTPVGMLWTEACYEWTVTHFFCKYDNWDTQGQALQRPNKMTNCLFNSLLYIDTVF